MKRRVSGHPHPVDVHVGSRVRLRRTLLGMSQEKLGQALRLTFQQIQKYEKGTNRVSAGRLHQISQIFGVPVDALFEGQEGPAAEPTAGKGRGAGRDDPLPSELFSAGETIALIRAYYQIADPEARDRLLQLVKALAESKTVGA